MCFLHYHAKTSKLNLHACTFVTTVVLIHEFCLPCTTVLHLHKQTTFKPELLTL